MRNRRGFRQRPAYDLHAERIKHDILQTERAINGETSVREWNTIDESLAKWYTVGSADPQTIGEGNIRAIMLEIAEEREAGRIRPFVEGEQIGTVQKPKVLTRPIETRAQRWERKQTELQTLRAKNDAEIARILEG